MLKFKFILILIIIFIFSSFFVNCTPKIENSERIDVYNVVNLYGQGNQCDPIIIKNANQFIQISEINTYKSTFIFDIEVVKNGTDVDIYACGFSTNDNNITVPCYWKNGQIYQLPVQDSTKNGEAYSIFIKDNDIYICGYNKNSFDIYFPCYWKNGVRTDLFGENTNYFNAAYSIFVNESNVVYTAGVTSTNGNVRKPSYWIGTTKVNLSVIDSTKKSEALGIVVVDNIPYICGYTTNNDGKKVACYWKNNVRYSLSIMNSLFDSEANSIYHENGNIYIAGYNYNSDGTIVYPCYWKNEQRVNLPIGEDNIVGMPGVINSIFVLNGVVFISGLVVNQNNNEWKRCYWANFRKIELGSYNSYSFNSYLMPIFVIKY